LDVEQIVKRRNSYGGTGVHQVKQAIIGAKTCLVEAMDPEKISKD
jgi:argininosuccinate lyase